ncbi:MAG: hypothetical protein ACFHU9_00370 [Fluviicola sp.]
MLRLLSYLLIAQFLFAMGMKVFLVLDWKINQDRITEKYCENKDKPMMNCNGKCYLSKQLEKMEQQENKERGEFPCPEKAIEKAEFISFINDEAIQFSLEHSSQGTQKGGIFKDLHSKPHLSLVFTPPQV